MRLLFLCAVALFSTVRGNSQTDRQHGSQVEYRPLVMLTEVNTFFVNIWDDSPTFVLYTNGIVIYRKENTYRTTRLDREEVGMFVRQLDLEGLDELDVAQERYIQDSPTIHLLLRVGGREREISFDGSLEDLKSSQRPAGLPISGKLFSALRQMMNYDSANSSVWKPDFVQVVLWPLEHAKGKPASWPKKWPGISDPATIKRGEQYSIFIPEAQSEELTAFLKRLKPTQAVLIDNRKWEIFTRSPFPHEMK